MNYNLSSENATELTMELDMAVNVASGAVTSVNGLTGAVVLTASDVGALADDTAIPSKTSDLTNDSGFITEHQSLSGYATENWVQNQGYLTEHQSLSGYATESYVDNAIDGVEAEIPTKTSDLTNDSGYLTEHQSLTGYATETWVENKGYLTSAPVSSVNGQTGAVVISNATTSTAGLMSATDKANLDTVVADYSSALTALGVN